MKTATVDGNALEYRTVGTGEPVVMIHGGLIADSFLPLLEQRELTDRYQLILYHRRGYANSAGVSDTITVEQHAADCLGLLRQLGVERAHVVGHSYGGAVALQMAVDSPSVVSSLSLLEPAFFSESEAEEYRASLRAAQARYYEVGADTVIDEFLTRRFGTGYRPALEAKVPGGYAQAVADAETFFRHEIPGLLAWSFSADAVRTIEQPVLLVVGELSVKMWPRFGETQQQLHGALPHAEALVLPGATHALQVDNPRAMADQLAAFWHRHPLVREDAHP